MKMVCNKPSLYRVERVVADIDPSIYCSRNKRSGSRKSSCSSISSLKNETPLDEKPSLFKAADGQLPFIPAESPVGGADLSV